MSEIAATPSPARTVPPPGPARFLLRACAPGLGARLARRSTAESGLTRATPVRGVVGFLSDRSGLGLSVTTALVARILDATAPGSVAVLDGDGVRQGQRDLLTTPSPSAPARGDLRGLLAVAATGHPRRLVDEFLAGTDPALLAAAIEQRGYPLTVPELDAATVVLNRRFPAVLVDLPFAAGLPAARWLAGRCDQLVVLTRDDVTTRAELRMVLPAADQPGDRPRIVRAVMSPARRVPGADVTVAVADQGRGGPMRNWAVLTSAAELARRLSGV